MIPKVKKFEYLSAIKNHQDGEIVFVEDLNQEYYYLEEEDKWIPYFAEEELVTVKESETPGTNLYQLNKMLVANLTNYGVEDIKSAKKLIRNFIDENPANVYMLLCHDLRYYTIFLKNKNYEENMEDVVIECLEYFGDIKSIEYDEDSHGIELWFTYEEEPFVAYLFGYDEGVILCK